MLFVQRIFPSHHADQMFNGDTLVADELVIALRVVEVRCVEVLQRVDLEASEGREPLDIDILAVHPTRIERLFTWSSRPKSRKCVRTGPFQKTLNPDRSQDARIENPSQIPKRWRNKDIYRETCVNFLVDDSYTSTSSLSLHLRNMFFPTKSSLESESQDSGGSSGVRTSRSTRTDASNSLSTTRRGSNNFLIDAGIISSKRLIPLLEVRTPEEIKQVCIDFIKTPWVQPKRVEQTLMMHNSSCELCSQTTGK